MPGVVLRQRPQASWIDIVTTGRAKAAIRKSLREEDRGRFIKLGQELARAAFDHVGKKASEKALRTAAKMLGLNDEEDLLARLGSAELTARRVVEALYPELARADLAVVDAAREVGGEQFVEANGDFLGDDVFRDFVVEVGFVVRLDDAFNVAIDGLFEKAAELLRHGWGDQGRKSEILNAR